LSRATAPGLMMLTAAVIDRHFREARLEHRVRFIPSGNDKGDDRVDVVEVEGGVPVSIRLWGGRYGVVRYHRDDEGEIVVTVDCGWFGTPSEAAACVVAVLRRRGA
jgi:hypothetical protein